MLSQYDLLASRRFRSTTHSPGVALCCGWKIIASIDRRVEQRVRLPQLDTVWRRASSNDGFNPICWGSVCRAEGAGPVLLGSFTSTATWLRGIRPALRHLLNILWLLRAVSLARVYVSICCTRGIRLVSCHRVASVSQAKARLSSAKTLISSGWSEQEVCGGNLSRLMASCIQNEIMLAVMQLLWPSMMRSLLAHRSSAFVEDAKTVVGCS